MRGSLRVLATLLDERPIVRRWVIPVVFMAAILFLVAAVLVPLFPRRYTAVDAAQLATVFFAFSLTVIAVGILAQKVIEYTVDRRSP